MRLDVIQGNFADKEQYTDAVKGDTSVWTIQVPIDGFDERESVRRECYVEITYEDRNLQVVARVEQNTQTEVYEIPPDFKRRRM